MKIKLLTGLDWFRQHRASKECNQNNGSEFKANMPTTNVNNVASAHDVATVGATAQVAVSDVSIGGNGNIDAFLALIGQELSVEELETA